MKKIKKIVAVSLIFICACSKKDGTEQSDASLFSRGQNPVYESPLGLAADPSVIKENDTLFMYYSAENGIGLALSVDDGINWIRPNDSQTDYISLERRPEEWDNTLETVEVLKINNEYKMYYTGYREGESDNPHVENYEIGLAVSQNGIDFTRVPESMDQPIIQRNTSNENTFDRHAMTSPGIVYDNGIYHMVYAGWNVTNDWTGINAGIRILGATSTNGIDWEKIAEPLLEASDVEYSPDVNEASILRTDDGFWFIPFSTDKSIGIARSTSFSGNYEVYPKTIVSPEFEWDSEVTAPDGIVADGKMRLWFHGVKGPDYWPWVIGYTESQYPLNW